MLLLSLMMMILLISSILLKSNSFKLFKNNKSYLSIDSININSININSINNNNNNNNNNQIEQIIYKTCKNCKKQYDNKSNDIKCIFHTGIYTGRLNRVNDVDTSDLEYFWSCCGNEELSSIGCNINEYHVSYDDKDDIQYSKLTGKKIKYQ
jgi:hypothetical protein